MKDQTKHTTKERRTGAQGTPGPAALAAETSSLGAYCEGLGVQHSDSSLEDRPLEKLALLWWRSRSGGVWSLTVV